MYGDFLVPNNTNVNNAITTSTGAKWEKMYSFTFEDSHIEGFEFPTDIDGTPLTLNGIWIEVVLPKNVSFPNMLQPVTINDDNIFNINLPTTQSVSYNERRAVAMRIILRNGIVIADRQSFNYFENLGTQSVNTWFTELDKITSFSFSTGVAIPTGVTFNFYVLRGV